MKFGDLSMTWKALSVMGVIFTTICVGLLIFIVLMFKTDLIPWPTLDAPSNEELEEEFGDFLAEFEGLETEQSECETERSECESERSECECDANVFYKHPIKDLSGNNVLEKLMPSPLITG